MDKTLTQIAVVLDRSGSMGSVVKPTIDNFNKFVEQQRATPGRARLRLVQFDHEYNFLYDKPLEQVEKLTTATFVPRGSTALFDAIGRTIDALGASLSITPETERPGKVIVLVLTDGYENASSLYTREQVASMVKHQREKYSWEFVFMGATQDAVLEAVHKLNFSPQSVFVGSLADANSVSDISKYTSTYRTS